MVTGTGAKGRPADGDWDWGQKSHGLCLTDGDWDWGQRIDQLMVTGTGAKERLAQPGCVAARGTAGRCGGKRLLGLVQLMSHQGPVHEIGSRIVLQRVVPLSPEDMEQTINVTHASVVSMKNRR